MGGMMGTMFNGGIPPIEQVRQAYALREEGLSYRDIGKRVGKNNHSVRLWIINPAKWSPYIDEIAVLRALAGDRKVFDNLSLFEWLEVIDRVVKLSLTLPDEGWTEFIHEMRDLLGEKRWRTIERRVISGRKEAKAGLVSSPGPL